MDRFRRLAPKTGSEPIERHVVGIAEAVFAVLEDLPQPENLASLRPEQELAVVAHGVAC